MRFWLVLLVVVSVGAPVARAQTPDPATVGQAAEQFERGKRLYNQGNFAKAVKAFSAANALSPHPSALFNIARCHENMGNAVEAMDHYRKALAATEDPAQRADIAGRIERLRNRPVKIFVSSNPSGARVTVDGKAAPEPGVTPLVVMLRPGAHVLVVGKEGYHLAVQRVLVKMGEEQPVEVPLRSLPEPCAEPKPCPAQKPCPTDDLVDVENLRLQLGVLGAFGVTKDRPVGAGPGVQLYLIYKRLFFGTHMLFFPLSEEATDKLEDYSASENIQWRSRQHQWFLLLVEGGYTFPLLDTAYLHATAGVGMSSEQVKYNGWIVDKNTGQPVKEEDDPKRIKTAAKVIPGEAFAWDIGGGVEALITRWLSLGVAARFGMVHGDRVDVDSPGTTESGSFPFGLFWATMTLHL